MIKLNDIKKSYGQGDNKIEILKGISLSIEEGEFVAIMGKSGSGKTTLLNILGCIDNADDGKLIVDDIDASLLKGVKLDKLRKEKMSFVFQNYALMREFNVYENIELPLNARDIPHKRKKKCINDIMELLDIEKLKNKYPGQLSGGEQQRTALARALVADTKYILADEPTGALDLENTEKLMNIFKQLNEKGKTIIMVTHDNDVAGYAGRIVRIQDGLII